MKKLFGVICAAMLVFGLAGQAAAAYDKGTLVQVIYEGDTSAGKEFNTGLGSVKTGDLTEERTIDAGQPGIGGFVTSDWDDLYAGFTSWYQVIETAEPWDVTTTTNLFFATTTTSLPVINGDAFSTYSSAANAMQNLTAGAQDKSTEISYWNKVETYASQSFQGVYSGLNYEGRANGFASLDILDDNLTTGEDTGSLVIGQYVDMYLWQYSETLNGFQGISERGFVGLDGEYEDSHIARLRIGVETDGEGGAQLFTQVTPVPVPAAVWLLGSGLLGLFGIRRRNNA